MILESPVPLAGWNDHAEQVPGTGSVRTLHTCNKGAKTSPPHIEGTVYRRHSLGQQIRRVKVKI